MHLACYEAPKKFELLGNVLVTLQYSRGVYGAYQSYNVHAGSFQL